MHDQPFRPRFQFSLRTLFVLVALAAVAVFCCHYAILRKHVSQADRQFNDACAYCDMGTGTYDNVFDASAKWLEAELRLPFADRVRAMSDHVERIEEWEKKAENRCGGPGLQEETERFRSLFKEAEEQLRHEQSRYRSPIQHRTYTPNL